jgi:hypothetical protein
MRSQPTPQAIATTKNPATLRSIEMQAIINLAIVMMPVIIMGVAMIIMGEF